MAAPTMQVPAGYRIMEPGEEFNTRIPAGAVVESSGITRREFQVAIGQQVAVTYMRGEYLVRTVRGEYVGVTHGENGPAVGIQTDDGFPHPVLWTILVEDIEDVQVIA